MDVERTMMAKRDGEALGALKTTTTLPANYKLRGTLDLSTNCFALFGVMVAGVALLLPFGWLVLKFLALTRPVEGSYELDGLGVAVVLGSLIGLTILVALAHELIHGLFFWLVTRRRPTFGFRGPYAFAASPGCYIHRDQYLVIGLAPLVLMSLIGLVLLLMVPVEAIPAVALMVVFNGAGSVADIFTVGLLLTRPRATLVCDRGDGCAIYQPD
ncbi:MAG TPA: DUF3267 domain-containing protein [Chloroflexota bacterium]|nr:DUF3267 domain-containing protein [Chloroflexota bacterium]